MELSTPSRRRLFRSKAAILALLTEHQQSGLSVQAFCADHSIGSSTFNNWRRRFKDPGEPTGQPAFAPLQLTSASSGQLFAEVRGIKLYQPVTAAYLNELAR